MSAKIARLMNWREIVPGSWKGAGIRWVTGCEDGGNYPVFDPENDANHAGLVIDYMADLGWMVTVYTGPYKNQGVKCRCCIMRGPQDFVLGGVDVVAETRPLAICRAFVEAMERWGDG